MRGTHTFRVTPNLKTCPQTLTDEGIKADGWVTVGELHGNALKFLYITSMLGITPVKDAQYTLFTKICRNNLTQVIDLGTTERTVIRGKTVERWEELMEALPVRPATKLRILGGDLASYGVNDGLTLRLYARLLRFNVDMEVLLSPKNLVFINHMENAIRRGKNERGQLDVAKFIGVFMNVPKFVNDVQAYASIFNLGKALNAASVDVGQLLNWYKLYKRTLKLFSYDYNDDNELVIYSHAPINRQQILSVADALRDEMSERERGRLDAVSKLEKVESHHLVSVIDAINRVVAKHAEDNTLNKLFYDNPKYKDLSDNPLHACLRLSRDPGDRHFYNTHAQTTWRCGERTNLHHAPVGNAGFFEESDLVFSRTNRFERIIYPDPAQSSKRSKGCVIS